MIKFGTSGWRGVIADDFTFDNVRLVSQAIAQYVNKRCDEQMKKQCAVLVGYDTRFLSDKFAEISAQVLAANGIKTLLCKRDTPTPVISYEILRRKIDGGINFTASHNPPEYNGLKFSPAWGGPALPETTGAIEKYCSEIKPVQIKTLPTKEAAEQKLLDVIDPMPHYLKRIRELVDFKAIRKGNLKIAVDLLFGTAAGYLDELLSETQIKHKVLHNWRDVFFGNHSPEPSRENLGELVSVMKKESCHLGIATDGDADRFGIIDSDGTFINPNQTIALLLYHLAKSRNWKGVAARSVMTTHLIDKIAAKFGIEVRETPVGFKFIGEVMTKEGNNFIIGGEESGGLTIRGHIPEKDGILACLLVAEMAAVYKKPLTGILKDIEKITGPVFSERFNFRLTQEEMEEFRSRLASELPDNFGRVNVKEIVTMDGYKFMLAENSWLGMRLSGTEPVVRMYIETDSSAKMKKLLSAGRKFILSGTRPKH